MACYHPIDAVRGNVPNESGKFPLIFNKEMVKAASKLGLEPIQVPCGQCIGCRLERSRQWAIRCVHEASLYEHNCFITLTYRDDCLPMCAELSTVDKDTGEVFDQTPTLVKADFQKFMKRFRDKFYPQKIRYVMCGEYGDQNDRPHYHACIFNFDFGDKVLWRVRDNVKLYRSPTLEKLWPFGFSTIGKVTFESAAYLSRYITKKVTGEAADVYYGFRVPEYNAMSLKPGIASGWFDKYASSVYPKDFLTMRGIKLKPPKYYDNLYEKQDSDKMCRIKELRKERALKIAKDCTPERLATREKVQNLRFKRLIRLNETKGFNN